MAKFVDKVEIQTPVVRYRNFDLSCQQLTSQFFMRTGVVYAKEFVKGSKIRMNLKTYVRMQPLVKPVLGSVQIHNRAFFVPFRYVWEPYEAFLTQAPYNNDDGTQILTSVPYVWIEDLFAPVLSNSTVLGESPDYSGPYDLFVDGTYYELNYKGRHYYKILRQLGYGYVDTVKHTFSVSALPLLCYAKVFMDYYFPSQFAHTGAYAFIDGFFNRHYVYNLAVSEVEQILECCRCTFYGNDYFVSAWETPVSPVGGTFDPNVVIPDVTNPYFDGTVIPRSDVMLMSNGTPAVRGYSSSGTPSSYPQYFTQYIDSSLKALTNYVTRHRLVGARVFDRYLADYGIALDDEILRRSYYLGTQSFPIQFQDVMSNADTISESELGVTGAQLGDYSGKGVAYDGQGNFAYDTNLNGYFIVINDVTPDIAYYQGIDRNVMHLTHMQFFQDEFQRLGTQPVYSIEANVSSSHVSDLFGFTQIYSEYKFGRDSLTGVFELGTKNVGLMSWSTARVLPRTPVHSFNFMRGDDSWQYARIFYGQYDGPESELDKFFMVHRCNVKASMQMLPMYDTYDFDEEEGEKLMMQANGTQFK